MTPVDTEDMAYASTFELFLEYGNDHLAKIFDRLQERLNKRRKKDRDTSERDQHKNEGKHHSEYIGARADPQAATTFGAFGHAGH
eukprot:7378946-Heterocapsa_arctica.AAC.1